MAEKTVAILNLSRLNRRYEVDGGLDKDGKTIVLHILPNKKAVAVSEDKAKFLLGVLPNGVARYPDLIDASKFHPEATQDRDAALEENAKLLKENAELRARLEGSSEAKKGGKK